jgi:hypothetical protein
MWNFLLAFFSARAVGRSRVLRRLLALFLFGALIAALIYTGVVFHAVTERSHARHVHPHSSN